MRPRSSSAGTRARASRRSRRCPAQVENCVTTVSSPYVTTSGQAWADFDVYMRTVGGGPERRRAAGIPKDLAMATKPQLAIGQVRRLVAAGCRPSAAFDEVYTRSGTLRETARMQAWRTRVPPCDFLSPFRRARSSALTNVKDTSASSTAPRHREQGTPAWRTAH